MCVRGGGDGYGKFHKKKCCFILKPSLSKEYTRLITSMNNSRASTDGQRHNFLKLTNQIRAGVCVRERDG